MAYKRPETLSTIKELLQACASETRLRLLNLLLHTDYELCVCEMVDALEVPQDRVSKSLKALKTVGVLTSRREGTWVHYRLDPDVSPLFRDLLGVLEPHLHALLAADLDRLARRIALREGDTCVVGFVPAAQMSKLLEDPAAQGARSHRSGRPPGRGERTRHGIH